MKKRDLTSQAAIAPAALIWTVFFLGPMIYLVVISFWRTRQFKLVFEPNLDNYRLAATDYLHAIIFTIGLASVVALATTVFAFLIAYFIRFRSGRFGTPLLFIVLITLFGGYLVKIYAWKSLLGSHGIINEALLSIGLISAPLSWLLYTPAAVIITLVHFLLPFAILPINAALRGVTDTPIEAARDLGASRRRTLWDVVLPQCAGSLMTAFTLCFLVSAGDYVTPQLVGGPNTFMIGNFIQSQFTNRMNAPVGAALSIATMLVSLVVLFGISRGLKSLLKVRIP